MLGYFGGLPAVYLAPMLAIPGLILLLGTTRDALCDTKELSRRLAVVAVPLTLAAVAIGTSAIMNDVSTCRARLATGSGIAVGMIPTVLGLEHVLRRNPELHETAWSLIRAIALRVQIRGFRNC